MSEAKLWVPATFVSFRRNKRQINPNQALLKIDGVNSKDEAKFYVGKKVASIVAKKIDKDEWTNWGTITMEHGNSGVVRANFNRNLPPRMLGQQLRVMLFPSAI
ncbi:ribosomal protein L35Ae [Tritrichomonas foetus]|uniref:Ribosomal protein L35Ae n=1 Tax=Tritrichomonas foetus TaxID=1144522 RepID=A0A1J4JZJ6_9EUKA|nr:ribosomal protein L35Ae [Tritrichomonas foetus]|eukprot:OHT04591.1 ribosomal protein L35Ae [Tritrichomonas foetus]